MLFSVFNPIERCFDYFEAPGTSANYGARGTKYRALHGAPQGPPRGLGPVGYAPESLAMPLPGSARRVGRGTEARGIVACIPGQRRGGLGASPAQLRWSGGGVGGLGGSPQLLDPVLDGLAALPMGEVAAAIDAPVVDVQETGVSFGKVVGAACVASIVGVLVQRALK